MFQLGIETVSIARFFGINLLFPGLIPAKAHFLAAQIAPVDPNGGACQALEEGPVMADRDEGTLISVQPAFQPVNRVQIKMICRFIQQQQIGGLRQCAGECCAALFTARCVLGCGAQINAQLSGNALYLMPRRCIIARQGKVHQRITAGIVRLLLQQNDMRIGLYLARAAIRLDFTGDQAQQSGFASTIAADQRHPVPRADMQIKAVSIRPAKKPAFALVQAQAFPGKNWRFCHRCAQLGAGRAAGKVAWLRPMVCSAGQAVNKSANLSEYTLLHSQLVQRCFSRQKAIMKQILASLAALAMLAGPITATDLQAQQRSQAQQQERAQSSRGEQQSAREQMRAGRNMPIRQIERRIIPRMEGDEYIGFEYDPAAQAYRLKFIRDGRVIWVDVDAQTARILRVSQ